jgi:hypothetical protein
LATDHLEEVADALAITRDYMLRVLKKSDAGRSSRRNTSWKAQKREHAATVAACARDRRTTDAMTSNLAELQWLMADLIREVGPQPQDATGPRPTPSEPDKLDPPVRGDQ